MTAHLTRSRVLAALLTGSALSFSPAIAQEGQPVFLGRITLDPAHVRAQDPDGNAADRASSEYVAEAELERARMGNLRDLFAGIASVSVGGAIPVAQKIYVNGVDMLNLAVSVDGVAQNNRIFHHISANAFDPGLMRFVRVDAGIAPADAGPHAMAGAVVMETVDAGDILEEGQRFGGNARVSASDNGRTLGRSLTLAGREGGFEWLAYGKRATGRDYKSGDGVAIEGSGADLLTGLLKLAWETPDGHRFELSGQRMDDDSLRPYRANFVQDGGPLPLRRYDTRRETLAFTYENTRATGLWNPKITIGRSEVKVGVDQPIIRPGYPAYEVSRGYNRTLSLRAENRFHLGETDTITVGFDHYEKKSRYSDALTAPVTESARNLGIYAQARLDPTEQLSLSFGLRWDTQDFTGTSGWKGSFDGFSGNASVSYALTEELKVRAGISSVFGGLTLEDNFIFNPAWDYSTLKPARSTNYSLGLDFERGNLTLEGEIFLTKIDDARLSTWARNANGDMESRGYNLGLGYGWEGGYLRASWSHSKATLNGAPPSSWAAVDLGTPLGGVFALEAQHRPEGSDFTWGGSVQAATAYKSTVAGTQSIPGYAVLNLFAEYEAPSVPGLTIRAEVNNLFDKTYADRATYGQDFSSIVPLHEPGRTISVVAAMKF